MRLLHDHMKLIDTKQLYEGFEKLKLAIMLTPDLMLSRHRRLLRKDFVQLASSTHIHKHSVKITCDTY